MKKKRYGGSASADGRHDFGVLGVAYFIQFDTEDAQSRADAGADSRCILSNISEDTSRVVRRAQRERADARLFRAAANPSRSCFPTFWATGLDARRLIEAFCIEASWNSR